MLNRKRHREEYLEKLDQPMEDLLHVYIDYWLEKDMFKPITIRIYEPSTNRLLVYVYKSNELHQLLLKAKEYYEGKTKRPYWVSMVTDDLTEYHTNMTKHHEQYDIEWQMFHYDSLAMLESRSVVLYTLSNHHEIVAGYYKMNVVDHHFVKPEEAYRVDFLRDAAKYVQKVDPLMYNNMMQAITAVRIKIEKCVLAYPQITQMLDWRLLRHYFNYKLE